MTTTDRYDWAKDYAAKLRKDLRKAAKDGTLPEGTTVSVRKETASLMTAVHAHVDTKNSAVYFDREGTFGATEAGRALASVLNKIVQPYLDMHDGKHSFVDISLDGRGFSPFL